MTNEEAINYGLSWQCAIQSREEDPYSDANQFLTLAIKALSEREQIRFNVYALNEILKEADND